MTGERRGLIEEQVSLVTIVIRTSYSCMRDLFNSNCSLELDKNHISRTFSEKYLFSYGTVVGSFYFVPIGPFCLC